MSAYKCIFLACGCIFEHISSASPVPGHSGIIPASPTTTGSCKLLIARKLPLRPDSRRTSGRRSGPRLAAVAGMQAPQTAAGRRRQTCRWPSDWPPAQSRSGGRCSGGPRPLLQPPAASRYRGGGPRPHRSRLRTQRSTAAAD